MSVITLTINGIEGSAPVGATLLDACRQNGVELPTLCHLEGLTPIGACRLCLVQVEGARRLLPACTTEAQEGMVVLTHTEKLVNYRKMILELLLSERNHICAVCVANGACELRARCAELGVDHTRFEYRCPDLPDIDWGDFERASEPSRISPHLDEGRRRLARHRLAHPGIAPPLPEGRVCAVDGRGL